MSSSKTILNLIEGNYKFGGLHIEDIELSLETQKLIIQNVNPHLLTLKLINCGLSAIPKANLQKFDQLYLIDLSKNEFTILESRLNTIPNLKSILISNNKIKSIPEIFNFSNIEELDLSYNLITEIDFDTLKLDRITHLDLSDNKGLVIRGIFPTSIVDLHINGLKLDVIPESIRNLENIESLWLFDNNLDAIPDWITDLPNLRILGLANNKFKNIPESILKIKSLEEIHFDDNFIEKIPIEIEQMTSLSEIYIENNRIKELPKSLEASKINFYL